MPFPPLSDAEWPAAIAEMRDGFAGRLNVYRVMAHHPALLRAWSAFRNHVVLQTTLGPARSEVVILRTGLRLEAEYEWAHHVVRGRAAGLSDARIRTLRGAPEAMTPEDAVLARAVDALLDAALVPEALQAEVTALVGVNGLFDVIATVGLYRILASIVKSFDTPIDADILAELAANPLN
ncbi:carboxymuconolactone decarboxylase family protein [bacterium]|nr:carboxymuconolactone decarboxylase family protein [bacterium]